MARTTGRSGFKMRSGNSTLFKQVGSSPVKQSVFSTGGYELSPEMTQKQASSKGISAWQFRKAHREQSTRWKNKKREKGEMEGKTLGKGISDFFSDFSRGVKKTISQVSSKLKPQGAHSGMGGQSSAYSKRSHREKVMNPGESQYQYSVSKRRETNKANKKKKP